MKNIGFAFLLALGLSFQALAVGVVALENFSSFGPGLYRGARPEELGFQDLKKLGIKTVIDLQGGDRKDRDFGDIAEMIEVGETRDWIRFEKKMVESMGMRFVNIPIDSLDAVNNREGKGLGKVLSMMNDPQNQPVYIHCEHGADRTGLAVALFRVYFQNWTKQAAHDEMVEHGHNWLHQLVTGGMDDFFWAATADKK